MRSILEQALLAQINKDYEKADSLFHNFLLTRSRQIHESLRQGEDYAFDDLDEDPYGDIDLGNDMFGSDDQACDPVDPECDPNADRRLDPYWKGDHYLVDESVDHPQHGRLKVLAHLQTALGAPPNTFICVNEQGFPCEMKLHDLEPHYTGEYAGLTESEDLEDEANEPKTNKPKANAPKANAPKANEAKTNKPKANAPTEDDSESDDMDDDFGDMSLLDDESEGDDLDSDQDATSDKATTDSDTTDDDSHRIDDLEDSISDLEAELARLSAEFDAQMGGHTSDNGVSTGESDSTDDDSDFDKLGESIASELEKVTISSGEGWTTGGRQKIDANGRALNVPPAKRQAGEPVKISSDKKDGYTRETAPKVGDQKSSATNRNPSLKKVTKATGSLLGSQGEDSSNQRGLFGKKK